MLQLEKLSYYQHLSLIGGQERRISACRVLDIRGTRYHVLSRIQDAGLDFTGRTNFLAQHLVFTPEEIRQFASPPVIFAKWSGWLNSWTKDPENLENEDWGNLSDLFSIISIPAQTWQKLSGDATNGYGMLEIRSSASFRVDAIAEEQILSLFAESLELLELRDTRKDFRASAWQYTFTTSIQEQDNPADFKWRCIHSDNPAAPRFAGPDCRAITDVKVGRVTNEEKVFAQFGRQPPRIVAQPNDVRLKEGETAIISIRAEGVPLPTYQWYSVDKNGAGQMIPNAIGPELSLTNPPFGVSRYVVQIANSVGAVTSEVAKVECSQRVRLAKSETVPSAVADGRPSSYDPEYETKRDNQRQRLQQQEAERQDSHRRVWSRVITVCGLITLAALVSLGVVVMRHGRAQSTNDPIANLPRASSTSDSAQASANQVTSNLEPSQQLSASKPTNEKTSKSTVFPSERSELPAGWVEMGIGESGFHSIDPFKPPYQFELSSYGQYGFRQRSDSVYFVCISNVSQSFETQVICTNALNGIMLRDSSDKSSRCLFIGATATQLCLYRRDEKGEYETNTPPYNRINNNLCFRFSFDPKEGKWTPEYSVDAVKWIPFEKFQFVAGSNALVGFAQALGNSNSPAKAKFRQMPLAKR